MSTTVRNHYEIGTNALSGFLPLMLEITGFLSPVPKWDCIVDRIPVPGFRRSRPTRKEMQTRRLLNKEENRVVEEFIYRKRLCQIHHNKLEFELKSRASLGTGMQALVTQIHQQITV